VNRRRMQLVLVLGLVSLFAAVGVAAAGGWRDQSFNERLTGYEETPMTISSPASGEFKARVDRRDEEIDYRLSYRGFPSDVTQAHIHFGARATSGGISVWLCANNPPITTAPAGTQACPTREGTISGTITPANVVGPSGQGIAANEFEELVDAMRAGVTYVNVHTVERGPGEIRAQLEDDDRDHDD
jgi:CHRD domain